MGGAASFDILVLATFELWTVYCGYSHLTAGGVGRGGGGGLSFTRLNFCLKALENILRCNVQDCGFIVAAT